MSVLVPVSKLAARGVMSWEQRRYGVGKVIAEDVSVRPGMDLSKIALPTFVLEPRSLLERITDFFSHPELIFG